MRFGSALVAVAGLFLSAALPVAAQASSCPIADDAVVATAIGSSVQSHAASTIAPGLIACNFEDARGSEIGVSRQVDAFAPGDPTGAAGLAVMFLTDVPDAARSQFAALNQIGMRVFVPGYELSSLNGVGDAALWVKSDAIDILFLQRGNDVYAFETDDIQDAQPKLTALAQAVLTTQ